MRLPRLLDAQLNEIARLRPESLSLILNLKPLSTAVMVLPEGEASVTVRQFVELYREDKSLGLFRVASVSTAWGRHQQVNLEHAVTTLEDSIMPVMEEEVTLPMPEALQMILNTQSEPRWQLGECDYTDTVTLAASEAVTLQALLDAADQAEGYALAFDFATSPWTLHLRRLSDTPACECRMSRNIATAAMTLDESELVTRVTSDLLPGGYLDGPTVSQWGVITRPLETEDEDDEASALEKANAYLERHKSPAAAMEIDAVDLSALTGESIDRFSPGDLCCLALPDWHTTAEERIITLHYADLIHAPQNVRLSMSSHVNSASSYLSRLTRQTDRNTRTLRHNHIHITETQKALLLHADLIEAQAQEIVLKVSKDDVVSAINLSPEAVKISSSRIELNGDVIVQALQGNRLDIDHLDAYSVSASEGEFSTIFMGGDTCVMQGTEVVTGVSGRGVTGEFKTIQYLNWDGAKASTSVMTGFTQAAFSTEKKTLNYIGAAPDE